MNRLLMTLSLLGLTSGPCLARGEEPVAKAPIENQESEGRAKQGGHAETYLGVGVQAVPEALHKQLPDVFPEGQGLLVDQVSKDSPAAKAGLKPYDVLKTYGDQTLTSPETLGKMVHADKAGKEVVIGYVRGGKSESCKVMLGQRELAQDRNPRRQIFRIGPDNIFRRSLEEFGPSSDNGAWDMFEAISLSRVNGDTWRAEIEYRAKDGTKQHHKFEGTRDQIAKDIEAMKDLPDNERQHLLRTLNLHQPVFEFHFPPVDLPKPGASK